ncbi:DUF3085 domain-containing protein [Foliimonas ilicis]
MNIGATPIGAFRTRSAARPMPPSTVDSAIHTTGMKPGEGDRPLVVCSEECHPVGNPDCFHYKHRHFGGDDGIEFIDAELLIPMFDRNLRCTHLNVQLPERQVSLSLTVR